MCKTFTAKAFTHSAWSESRARRQNVLVIANSNFQINRKWKYDWTLIFKILNSQSSTSYSTPIQITTLLATVSTLETTSGFGGTGSTDIGRRRTSKTVLEPPTSNYWAIIANFGQTPFATKPDVEIRRKWSHTSTRNRRLPIRIQYNVRVCRPPFQR